ncbi:MAG: helix-turn-helix transcriptional regulator [Flavisolibacter sp.]|nr:helix-turn-helix transcriptional regulator [Flavisolibacter sp.]
MRKQKGQLQKQVATQLKIGQTNYNKLENGHREPLVKERQSLAQLFGLSVDQILNYEGELLWEVKLEDKPCFEQINLINQPNEEEKITVFKIIDTMLTKTMFKGLFQNNVAVL